MGSNDLNSIAMLHLSFALKVNRVLQELSMRDNKVGDTGVLWFAQSLKRNDALQWLSDRCDRRQPR